MATLVHLDNSAVQMRETLTQYKEESEKVRITSQNFAGVILNHYAQENLEVGMVMV